MEITEYSVLIIIGCGIVTWLPRIIPFILVRKLNIPETVLRFLSYVPLCILTALFVQNLFIVREDQFPDINYTYILASVPTVLTAIITKNLLWIVLIGVIAMALTRYFLI